MATDKTLETLLNKHTMGQLEWVQDGIVDSMCSGYSTPYITVLGFTSDDEAGPLASLVQVMESATNVVFVRATSDLEIISWFIGGEEAQNSPDSDDEVANEPPDNVTSQKSKGKKPLSKSRAKKRKPEESEPVAPNTILKKSARWVNAIRNFSGSYLKSIWFVDNHMRYISDTALQVWKGKGRAYKVDLIVVALRGVTNDQKVIRTEFPTTGVSYYHDLKKIEIWPRFNQPAMLREISDRLTLLTEEVTTMNARLAKLEKKENEAAGFIEILAQQSQQQSEQQQPQMIQQRQHIQPVPILHHQQSLPVGSIHLPQAQANSPPPNQVYTSGDGTMFPRFY